MIWVFSEGTVMKSGRCLPVALSIVFGLVSSGCSELRARQAAQEGNELFLDGDYAAAVSHYERSQELYPDIPQVLLNKGLACRHMMATEDETASKNAAECALNAFSLMQQKAGDDPRGEELYVQTLFDASRFDTLQKRFEEALAGNPKDLGAINGLILVHSRSGNWQQTLVWTRRRAGLLPRDAEAQYAVGVFCYNVLFERGGNSVNATFDPRKTDEQQAPPIFEEQDVKGQQRVELADLGIEYLKKALELAPDHRESLAYMTLLYRQRSLAFLDDPVRWQENIADAERWRKQAQEADKAAGQGKR